MYTDAHTGSVTAGTHQVSTEVVRSNAERGQKEGIYFFAHVYSIMRMFFL